MKALHAGYVSEAVWKATKEQRLARDLDWIDVLTQLSHFVIDRDIGGEGILPPELIILDNIICRGLPTLPSLGIEKILEEYTGLIQNNKLGKNEVAAYSCSFSSKFADNFALLERALCPVASGALLEPSTGFTVPQYDNDSENIFFNGPLVTLLGPGGAQIVVNQRHMDTISEGDFIEQRTDFSIQLPGSNHKGLIFEVDGPSHATEAQSEGDRKRDEACISAGWAETYRHKLWQGIHASNPVDVNHRGLAAILQNPYLRRLNQNINEPLANSELGKRVNFLVLFPFAIARIQKVLLELVRGNVLSLEAHEWHLAVIDRDGLTGCGKAAAEDFRTWVCKIWAMYKPGCSVPIIHIYEIGQNNSVTDVHPRVDVLLDISVQLRYGVSLPDPIIPEHWRGIPKVVIRSDYYKSDPDHHMSFGNPVTLRIEGEVLEQELTFFLQNIFRKVAFRPKQVEIIVRAIRGESVIALLPTGAGKSVTYQLPTLLQNGMTVVIDPIKSLMKDQDDNLKSIGISCSAFINSMTTSNERRQNTEFMKEGCFKFVFVSPERFIIREFRDAMKEIRDKGIVHFAYAVVDEAHCVSEWGHDFRTAYLRLGANARKFCPTRMPQLPLLALTGTASYEVLEDVRVELGHERNANISVRPDSMERKNLKYRVVRMDPQPEILKDASEKSIRQIVGETKLEQLPTIITNITQKLKTLDISGFLNGNNGSGLVFCPHTKWVFGAEDVCKTLRQRFEQEKEFFGVYYGSSEDGGVDSIGIQDDFKRGKLKVLACTKAFGMGIDKSDVRFTVHYNIPSSLESFYQEAGRSGRDGEESQCWIFYSGTKISGLDESVDYSINKSFHTNTFPGPGIELAQVFEMLDENRSRQNLSQQGIEVMLLDETTIMYSVSFWRANNGKLFRVYINHPDYENAKVFIELLGNGDLEVGQHTNPFPDHERVSQLVISWLRNNKPQNIQYRVWLFQPGDLIVNPGLEAFVNSIGDDMLASVCFSFENGYLEDIGALLPRVDVRKKYQFVKNVEEFLVNLGANGAAQGIQEQIKSIFSKVRLREHTFRAIYRLSLLGIIDDFEADYSSRTITAKVRRLRPGVYRENLRNYIHRYAPMDVDEYLTMVDDPNNTGTELRRCLHALIQFVYARIARQRIAALGIMEQTTKKGLDDEQAFTEAVTTFFDSKYLPILRPHLNDYDADLVFRICKDTGGSDSNLTHLLGACNRLLPENPDNAAFHALRAYTTALLGYADRDVEGEIETALILFEKYMGWKIQDKITFLMRLRKEVALVNGNRTQAFDAIIIEGHMGLLKNYNMSNAAI